MFILSLLLLGAAVLSVWTYCTRLIIKRQRPSWGIVLVILGLALASAPLLFGLHSDARREAQFVQASTAFQEHFGDARLVQVSRGPRAWLYSYLNDDEPHMALLIGTDWLEVELEEMPE